MVMNKQEARRRIHSLRCRSAALRRVNAPGFDREASTVPMRAALWRKYEALADPDSVLTQEERTRRARGLWSADMAEAKAEKLKGRLRSLKGETAA
jgi:hypothetical protein